MPSVRVLTAFALIAAACVQTTQTIPPEALAAARDRMRVTEDPQEMAATLDACLKSEGQAGYTLTVNQGGFGVRKATGTEAEGKDWRRAVERCQRRLVEDFPKFFDPEARVPRSRVEFAALYELYGLQADCLRSMGYSIEMISLESYIDRRGDWYPYDELPPSITPQEWGEITSACPQTPWAYEGSIPTG